MINPLYDNYSIIPQYADYSSHNEPLRLLLIQEAQGWTLPRHNSDSEMEISELMRDQLGLTTTFLYTAYDRYRDDDDDEREEIHRVYALENHSPGVEPRMGKWMSREAIAGLDLLVPEHRAVIEAWFDEMEHDSHRWRLPWMYSGWYDQAVAWIREQIASLGYTITGEIVQVKVRVWSEVMRVPTDGGMLYFKAVPTYFAYEPRMTQLLYHYAPTQTPPLLVVDEQRLWMLMQDAGTVMRGERDPKRWETMLTLYAQLQMKLIDHVDELLAADVPDGRLLKLPRIYEDVLADRQFLLLGQEKGLPMHEYEQLLSMTPQVEEMCAKLASYDIPETLHHDDLHGNNVLWNGETYIFFDWSDSFVTHPFCSLFIVLRVATFVLKFDEETQNRLITAYLTPWTRYAPMEQLREAFTIAHRLGTLLRSLTYYYLIKSLEPSMREDYEDALPYFLRVFLGHVVA